MTISLIEKESVSTLEFAKREVLTDKQAIAWRKSKLERALLLGNLYKVKSRIFFETNQGSKVVETTIWAVTSNYILLKGGLVIPIQCITGVE